MKSRLLGLAVCSVLLLTVATKCKKDNPDDPGNDPPAQKTCRLMTVGDSDRTVATYAYNDQKRVSSMATSYQGFSGEYQFTYDGDRIIRSEFFRAGSSSADILTEYEYNGSGNISSATMPSDLGGSSVQKFEYNGAGKVTKKTNLVSILGNEFERGYVLYQYDGSGRVSKASFYEIDFMNGGTTPVPATVREYEYDDKKAAFGGSNQEIVFYGGTVFSSNNNVRKETIKDPQGVIQDNSTTTTFTYNAEGYPVSALVTYNTGDAATSLLTYQCD